MVGPESQTLTAAAGVARSAQPRLHALSHLQRVPHRGRISDRARHLARRSSARGSARRSAPRSTTAAWRNRSASMSTGCSPSRSPSAAAWPALGGGLGAEFLGLDPQYALKYLVYFLIVVSVGGLGSVARRLLRRAAARRARLRAQALSAQGRHHLHLRAHHPAPAVAAAGAVRKERDVSVAARPPSRPPFAARIAHPAARVLMQASSLSLVGGAALARRDRLLFRLSRLSRLRHRAPDHRPVRALARSRARLCRHHHARPRGVLRHRRLYGRAYWPFTASGPSRSRA